MTRGLDLQVVLQWQDAEEAGPGIEIGKVEQVGREVCKFAKEALPYSRRAHGAVSGKQPCSGAQSAGPDGAGLPRGNTGCQRPGHCSLREPWG